MRVGGPSRREIVEETDEDGLFHQIIDDLYGFGQYFGTGRCVCVFDG